MQNNASLDVVLNILDRLTKETHLAAYVTDDDMSYIRKRSHREGLKFLTKTLPLLGKSLERGLASGVFVCPPEFKQREGTLLPKLLYGAFRLIFQDDGELIILPQALVGTELDSIMQSNNATACLAVRQVTLMVYKAKLEHEPEQIEVVKEAFRASEDHVWEYTKDGHAKWSAEPVFQVARSMVHRLLGGVNPYEIKPKHGGGACADLRSPWERYEVKRFIPKLDAVFPYTEYFCTAPNGLSALCERLQDMPVEEDPPARVCFVPKDSRGPRLISCEPSEFMYIQQGLMTLMYEAIRRFPIVREQLDCEDQTRNQRAAQQGSITGDLATLDLKEASDCVSWSLVRFLFPEDWIRAFDACRSERTIFPPVPGAINNALDPGEEIPLWKFAPMGSACCFPVEAIVFWALTCAVVYSDPVKQVFRYGTKHTHTTVRIFGDDIVCPTRCAPRVIEVLTLAGLKVNVDKSYMAGPFRESCGTDWYRGHPVKIVKLNNLPTFHEQTGYITIGSAFRLLDFLGEIQGVYGPWLDPWFKQLLDSVCPEEVPVNSVRPPGTFCLGSMILPPTIVVRSAPVPKDRKRPYYGQRQARLRVECGVNRVVDTRDWCHVLRALLNQGGDRAELVGLKGRQRYKRKWVNVDCVDVDKSRSVMS